MAAVLPQFSVENSGSNRSVSFRDPLSGLGVPLGAISPDGDFVLNSANITVGRSSLLTAAAYRTLASRAEDRFDIRDMLGADLTGVNDMSAIVTRAFAEAEPLHVPNNCVLALGSTIEVPSNAIVVGAGTQPYTSFVSGGSRGAGAWFHITHEDAGFVCGDGVNPATNIKFEGIGTFRDQPVPGVGWTPNDHDYDFVIDNAEVEMNDVMLLNATRGVRQISGPAGRLYIRKLRGQPFLSGIRIDDTYDGLLMDGVRWWPFWSNDLYTRAYTKANRIGMYLGHCDNPQISWYFNIFSHIGVVIGSSATGVPNSVNFYNLENDLVGGQGMVFEAGSNGSHVTVIGGYTFGETGSTNAVEMHANNSKYISVGHKTQNIMRSALVMGAGVNNVARITAPDIENWNVDNVGVPAFYASADNKIIIDGQPIVSGGNGAALTSGNVGLISSIEYVDVTGLSVTAQSGTITSATGSGRLRRVANQIEGTLSATITNNGTGAGDLRIALPVAVKSGLTFDGSGRNLTTGVMLQVQLNGSVAVIATSGNAYPVTTGDQIRVTVRYETEPFL